MNEHDLQQPDQYMTTAMQGFAMAVSSAESIAVHRLQGTARHALRSADLATVLEGFVELFDADDAWKLFGRHGAELRERAVKCAGVHRRLAEHEFSGPRGYELTEDEYRRLAAECPELLTTGDKNDK